MSDALLREIKDLDEEIYQEGGILDSQKVYLEELANYNEKLDDPEADVMPAKRTCKQLQKYLIKDLNYFHKKVNKLRQKATDQSELDAIKKLVEKLPPYPTEVFNISHDEEMDELSDQEEISSESFSDGDMTAQEQMEKNIADLELMTELFEEFKEIEKNIIECQRKKEDEEMLKAEAEERGDMENATLHDDKSYTIFRELSDFKEDLSSKGDVVKLLGNELLKGVEGDEKKLVESLLQKVDKILRRRLLPDRDLDDYYEEEEAAMAVDQPILPTEILEETDDDIINISDSDDDAVIFVDEQPPPRESPSRRPPGSPSRKSPSRPQTPQLRVPPPSRIGRPTAIPQGISRPTTPKRSGIPQPRTALPQPTPSFRQPTALPRQQTPAQPSRISRLPLGQSKVPSLAKIHPFLGGTSSIPQATLPPVAGLPRRIQPASRIVRIPQPSAIRTTQASAVPKTPVIPRPTSTQARNIGRLPLPQSSGISRITQLGAVPRAELSAIPRGYGGAIPKTPGIPRPTTTSSIPMQNTLRVPRTIPRPSTAQPRTIPRPSTAQKIPIETQNLVEQIFKKNFNEMKEEGRQLSIEDRKKAELKNVRKFILGIVDHQAFFNDFVEAQTPVAKLQILEVNLRKIFEILRVIMTIYRGDSFRFNQNDQAKIDKFISDIVKSFSTTMSFDSFRSKLSHFFAPQKMPYPEFKVFQPHQLPGFVVTPSTPSSRLARPSTTPGRTPASSRVPASTPFQRMKPKLILPSRTASAVRRRSSSRLSTSSRTPMRSFQERMTSMGAITPTKAKVQEQVRNLTTRSLQKSMNEPSTRQKLESFLTNFCKIFIMNQHKNRGKPYKEWVGTFYKNVNPILNDLDVFYKSLPFHDFKKFDRKSLESALDKFLKFVYEKTKDQDISNLQCKNLVGEEMKKVIECKQLSDLSNAMGVFIDGAKELLMPHLNRMDQIRMTPGPGVSRIAQPSRVARGIPRPKYTSRALSATTSGQSISTLAEVPQATTSAQSASTLAEIQSEEEQTEVLQEYTVPTRSFVEREKEKEEIDKFMTEIMKYIKDYDKAEMLRTVIGFSEELYNIEWTRNKYQALNVLLTHIINIEQKLAKFLVNDRRYNTHKELKEVLFDFWQQIIYTIYDDDHEVHFNKIQELKNVNAQVKVDDLVKALGPRTYMRQNVEDMLQDPYNYKYKYNPLTNEELDSDDERAVDDEKTEYVLEYIKKLRAFESKYIWEVLNDNFFGPADLFITAPDKNAPMIDEEKAEYTRMRSNYPIVCRKGAGRVPDDIIERDILYAACRVPDENCRTRLEKMIMDIAVQYQNKEIPERKAIKAIKGILDAIQCIPIDFYEVYFYYPENPYFEDVYFDDIQYNVLVRSNILNRKGKYKCYSKTLYDFNLHHRNIDRDLRYLLADHNDNSDEYLQAILLQDSSFDEKLIPVAGTELANNGNGVLGVPNKVDSTGVTEGKLHDVRINQREPYSGLSANAREGLLIADTLLEYINKKYGNENDQDNLENSRIAQRAIIYELKPAALKRMNLWQPRGSEMPKWFPGIYTVFPDTHFKRPEKSILPMNKLLMHAWRVMAPKTRGG